MRDSIQEQHEGQFARAFIQPNKRARYEGFLSKKRTRHKFIDELPHFSDFDPRCVRPISKGGDTEALVLRSLQALGAPSTCWTMSCWSESDACEELLSDAVVQCPTGTILSCIPGALAYYEGETRGDRCILHRPAN